MVDTVLPYHSLATDFVFRLPASATSSRSGDRALQHRTKLHQKAASKDLIHRTHFYAVTDPFADSSRKKHAIEEDAYSRCEHSFYVHIAIRKKH
jgi:hypothetical protein